MLLALSDPEAWMSWQNVALSWFFRRRMKRLGRGLTGAGIDVTEIRTSVGKLRLSARAPNGWRIRTVDAAPGRIAGEWIEATTPGLVRMLTRTVLYLHGGGYFFCSPRTHRSITGGLARAGLARVFVPDYRLAPEHPFPAAPEDALVAYRQLLSDGISARTIVVAGDSAGGGLTLALLLALREAGDPLPGGAILFSPWTDLAVTGATVTYHADRDVMFDGSGLRSAAALYLGGAAADDWRASPLYGEFHGLPPLFVQASDSEVLLDDARRVVDKAREAGVEVTFKIWPSLPHAWQIFAPFLPEARAALREAGEFIRRRSGKRP